MNVTNHSRNKHTHTHKLNDNYKNNERLIRTRCFKEQECKKQWESKIGKRPRNPNPRNECPK